MTSLVATKSPRLNYKDVQICFLAKGLPSVRTAFQRGEVGITTMANAAEALGEKGAELAAYVEAVKPRRGRKPPTAGVSKSYKVQQQGWVRVPVSVLGASKGDSVIIRFESDSIIIIKSKP